MLPQTTTLRLCSVDDCLKVHRCHGFCDGHYSRWRKHGEPLASVPLRARGVPFLDRVNKDGPNGCWLWLGGTDTSGYGQLWLNGRQKLAHRYFYEMAYGLIPEGMQIDHLCRVRRCVNPDHLEVVTHIENIRRGTGSGSRTYCPKGHPYDPSNTVFNSKGHRECRICRVEWNRRSYEKKLAAR